MRGKQRRTDTTNKKFDLVITLVITLMCLWLGLNSTQTAFLLLFYRILNYVLNNTTYQELLLNLKNDCDTSIVVLAYLYIFTDMSQWTLSTVSVHMHNDSLPRVRFCFYFIEIFLFLEKLFFVFQR